MSIRLLVLIGLSFMLYIGFHTIGYYIIPSVITVILLVIYVVKSDIDKAREKRQREEAYKALWAEEKIKRNLKWNNNEPVITGKITWTDAKTGKETNLIDINIHVKDKIK